MDDKEQIESIVVDKQIKTEILNHDDIYGTPSLTGQNTSLGHSVMGEEEIKSEVSLADEVLPSDGQYKPSVAGIEPEMSHTDDAHRSIDFYTKFKQVKTEIPDTVNEHPNFEEDNHREKHIEFDLPAAQNNSHKEDKINSETQNSYLLPSFKEREASLLLQQYAHEISQGTFTNKNKIGKQQSAPEIGQEAVINKRSRKKPESEKVQHICNLCDKKFTKSSTLVAHLRTHTGEKPHKCETCGKMFGQISNLRTHMSVHSGDKPFTCHVCFKQFRLPNHLKRHFLIHSDEKPHACAECGRQFKDKSNLKAHMRIHLDKKSYIDDANPSLSYTGDAHSAVSYNNDALPPLSITGDARSSFVQDSPRKVKKETDAAYRLVDRFTDIISKQIKAEIPDKVESVSAFESRNANKDQIESEIATISNTSGQNENSKETIGILDALYAHPALRQVSSIKVEMDYDLPPADVAEGSVESHIEKDVQIKVEIPDLVESGPAFEPNKTKEKIESEIPTYSDSSEHNGDHEEKRIKIEIPDTDYVHPSYWHQNAADTETELKIPHTDVELRSDGPYSDSESNHVNSDNLNTVETETILEHGNAEEKQMKYDNSADEVINENDNSFDEDKMNIEIQNRDYLRSSFEEEETAFDLEQYAHDIGQAVLTNTSKSKIETSGKAQNICYFCDKQFSKASGLAAHMRTHTGEKPHKCEICEKQFTQSTNLRTHMLIHSAEKPYTCQICSRQFRLPNHLKRHVLSHTDEKPYHCEICYRKFKDIKKLNIHVRVHTHDYPFECQQCDKKFKYSGNLKQHELTHSGEKPISCTLCPKKFRRASTFKMHMLTHTGERPHSCENCEKKFRFKSNLDIHVMRMHSAK